MSDALCTRSKRLWLVRGTAAVLRWTTPHGQTFSSHYSDGDDGRFVAEGFLKFAFFDFTADSQTGDFFRSVLEGGTRMLIFVNNYKNRRKRTLRSVLQLLLFSLSES